MASRLVFTPTDTYPWFKENLVDFEWVPGLAKSQAQKSIRNLHDSAKKELKIERILEVSTKSGEILGQQLSAFNLQISRGKARSSLESTYQASKLFVHDLQFDDLLEVDALKAKTDPRLRNSGVLTGYRFENQLFRLLPSPNFYDYLYVRALLESENSKKVLNFQAFTDHAFSGTGRVESGKSVNCQARSLAIFIGISRTMPIDSVLVQLLETASRDLPHEQESLFDL